MLVKTNRQDGVLTEPEHMAGLVALEASVAEACSPGLSVPPFKEALKHIDSLSICFTCENALQVSRAGRCSKHTHVHMDAHTHTHMFSKHRGAGMCSSALATEIWEGWEKEGQLRSSSQCCRLQQGEVFGVLIFLKGQHLLNKAAHAGL